MVETITNKKIIIRSNRHEIYLNVPICKPNTSTYVDKMTSLLFCSCQDEIVNEI